MSPPTATAVLRMGGSTAPSVADLINAGRLIRNSLAEMERISGRKIHRDNAGHHRHRRHAVSDFRTTAHERDVSQQCEELLDECDSMRNRFALLAAQNTRTAAEEAKRLVAKFNHHKERLATMHRHIPPLSSGDF